MEFGDCMGVNVILGSHVVCYGSHHNFLSRSSSNEG